MEFLKLYEIPRESKIICDVSDGSSYIIFHRVDGSFSVCTTENNNRVHLYVNSNLEKIEDRLYKLKKEE